MIWKRSIMTGLVNKIAIVRSIAGLKREVVEAETERQGHNHHKSPVFHLLIPKIGITSTALGQRTQSSQHACRKNKYIASVAGHPRFIAPSSFVDKKKSWLINTVTPGNIKTKAIFREQMTKDKHRTDKATKALGETCTLEERTKIFLFYRKDYMAPVPVGISAIEMHPVACVFDTGAGPNLIREDFLRQGWHRMIRGTHRLDSKGAASESVCVLGKITLHVRMSNCRVRVDFFIIRNLEVTHYPQYIFYRPLC